MKLSTTFRTTYNPPKCPSHSMHHTTTRQDVCQGHALLLYSFWYTTPGWYPISKHRLAIRIDQEGTNCVTAMINNMAALYHVAYTSTVWLVLMSLCLFVCGLFLCVRYGQFLHVLHVLSQLCCLPGSSCLWRLKLWIVAHEDVSFLCNHISAVNISFVGQSRLL